MSFTFINNADKVLQEFERQKQRGLKAIGQTAVAYAKKDTPVDTGRLRNSEDFRVQYDEVYIGTNVEYAPYIEFGHHDYPAQHFLKNAAANHAEEYKNILETSLKS